MYLRGAGMAAGDPEVDDDAAGDATTAVDADPPPLRGLGSEHITLRNTSTLARACATLTPVLP